MDKQQAARKWLVTTALSYLGTPYRWGGDDPSGFDCSGLVVECLKSAGIIQSGDYSADGLYRLFRSREILEPKEGSLIFRLDADGKASHVVICLDRWFRIGAEGGGLKTRNQRDARRDNAFVKIRAVPPPSSQRKILDPFVPQKE